MKKALAVIALLLCLGLLAGCGAQAVLHDIAEQLVNDRTDESRPGDAEPSSADGAGPAVTATDAAEEPVNETPADEAPASESDAGEQVPQSQLPEEGSPVDFTALSLAECVTDADGAADQLPRIVLDCPGADYINDDVEGTFRYLVDSDYCTLYYTASKNGPILSVMIAQLYDGDASYFNPYMLDLSTGEVLSGAELLSLLGLSAGELAETELRIMGDEFEYEFGSESFSEDPDFYREQYDRTVSPDNAELDRLWLDDEGELNFVAKIYSLAGAEFYEYPMGTGYFY